MKHKKTLFFLFLVILSVFLQTQIDAKALHNTEKLSPNESTQVGGLPTTVLIYMKEFDINGGPTNNLCFLGDTALGCVEPGSGLTYPPQSQYIMFEYAGQVNPIRVDIENYYLHNVLPREMNVKEVYPTLEALKAQALAARTIADWKSGDNEWITNVTTDQVFVPGSYDYYNNPDERDAIKGLINQAIIETSGQYLSFNGDGQSIDAEFGSDFIGQSTSEGTKSYLISIQDPISSTCDATTIYSGWGMSQKGAIRWSKGNQCAANGDQPWSVRWDNYKQILVHYYSGIDILDGNGTKVAPDDRWNLIGHNVPLDANRTGNADAGQTYPLNLQLQNTSTSDWVDNNTKIGYQWTAKGAPATGAWTEFIGVSVPATNKGALLTSLEFPLTMPSSGGDYTLHLDLQRNGHWFSAQLTAWPDATIDFHVNGPTATATPVATTPVPPTSVSTLTPTTTNTPTPQPTAGELTCRYNWPGVFECEQINPYTVKWKIVGNPYNQGNITGQFDVQYPGGLVYVEAHWEYSAWVSVDGWQTNPRGHFGIIGLPSVYINDGGSGMACSHNPNQLCGSYPTGTWRFTQNAETNSFGRATVGFQQFTNPLASVYWTPQDAYLIVSSKCDCPNNCSAPQALSDNQLLYRVRDEILSQAPIGQHFTDLYYGHGIEITQILISNSTLREEAGTTLQLWEPKLRALADGQGNTELISQEDVDAIDHFLSGLEAVASNDLRTTIQSERAELNMQALVGQTMSEAWEEISGAATATPTATQTPTPSATATSTPTFTPTNTATNSPTATQTPSFTPTLSPSQAAIDIFIGGVKQASYLVSNIFKASYAGVNTGPVKVAGTNEVPIIASERVIYEVNGIDTSYSEMMALPNSQLDTTYWLPWYNNVGLDTQLRFANVSSSTAMVRIFIGGMEVFDSPFSLAPGVSVRKSFAGVNSGPVEIRSNVNIVAAERVIYKVDGVETSYSETMALPNRQLDTIYWLPWYNNVGLDTQLRIGNVSNSTATVHVYVGGTEMTGSPFTLASKTSLRQSFAGINNGPVKIVSDVPIVAAERVIYKVNNVYTSYSETMALPDNQLDKTYWMPWYDNVGLDTQLRFANVTDTPAIVHVYIGSSEMTGSPFTLAPGTSIQKSFAGNYDGPVKIVSDVNIVAAERVIYSVNGTPTSFSEMMGLPNRQLDILYWMPWYHNDYLNTELRFGPAK